MEAAVIVTITAINLWIVFLMNYATTTDQNVATKTGRRRRRDNSNSRRNGSIARGNELPSCSSGNNSRLSIKLRKVQMEVIERTRSGSGGGVRVTSGQLFKRCFQQSSGGEGGAIEAGQWWQIFVRHCSVL